MTKKVMRNIQTSFIMALILRMMGPKYFDAMPILIILMIANVKAMPHNILPAELRGEMSIFSWEAKCQPSRGAAPTRK